jgi:hypothetical protein
MKKTIIAGAICVVVVVGYLGISPIVTSKIVEKNFSTVASNIANESNIVLEDTTYQASLTGGTAYTTFQPYGQSQDSPVKVKHEISTLPFYTKIDGSSGLAAAYIQSTLPEENFSAEVQEKIKTAFSDRAPVLLETVVDYSGNYHLTLTINPAEFQVNQKNLTFSGLEGNFNVNKDGTQVTGKAQFQSFLMNSDGSAVQLADFETNIDQAKNAIGLWIGKSDVKIATINAQTPMGEFNANKVSMEANAVDQSQTLDYLVKLIVTEIVSPEGFPLAVNSMDYQIALNNVDSSAAASLLQALEDTQHKLQTGTPEEQQQLAQQFGTQNSESFDQLLRANPTMTQRLMVDTAQGTVNIDLDANFSGFTQDQTVAGLKTPTQLIQYVSGTLKAKSPLAILLMTPLAPQLEAYQQQGLLKVEGDTAFVNAKLKDSLLTLNDKPIPLQF